MIAARLFAHPRGSPPGSGLLSSAARAHQHLFEWECEHLPQLGETLPRLRSCCREGRRLNRLLCHPSFVEALHRLAPECPRLASWHRAVASPSMLDVIPDAGHDFGGLGALEFVLRLREGSGWDRPLRVSSDMLGRLQFPFSDWSVTLQTSEGGHEGVLAEEPVNVSAGPEMVDWQWTRDDAPFLAMSRECCRQMFVDNQALSPPRSWSCTSVRISPRFVRAEALCEAGARYERIHIADARHAAEAANIVAALHAAMQRASPPMHAEFCHYMVAVRGYELRLNMEGVVQSFSDPSLPGVMNFNVPFDERDHPCLSPLCFTWLAHELAHTKFYLINDIAFDHGWTFVRNGCEMTDEVARYRRRLPVRTLFQIPYTHVYEWESLMDFLENDFAGLPWSIGEDPFAFGEDLRSEIEEAMQLCDELAEMTPLGAAAFVRFRELYDQSLARWRAMTAV